MTLPDNFFLYATTHLTFELLDRTSGNFFNLPDLVRKMLSSHLIAVFPTV